MRMIRLIIIICLVGLMATVFTSLSRGQETTDKIQNLQEQIRDLEKKLVEAQDRRKTLSNQISYMDSQISLTQLRINDTESKIDSLEHEIASLSGKIERLEISLGQLSQLLINRISETYKKGRFSYLELLFTSGKFSDFLNRFHYIQIVQANDKKLLYQVQEAKQTFEEKRKLREEKKAEQEKLRSTLLSQKKTLDSQRKEKEYLLSVTKNDEKRYQDLRAAALAELNQIQKAAEFLKAGAKPYHINRGDVVGVQGNTGYSFGEHLHFGVYNYKSMDSMPADWYHSNSVEPSTVLSSRSVTWDESCGNDGQKTVGSGSWDWPYKSDFRITQGFGYTCYSNSFYNGNPHPAYDMAGSSGATIYAVEQGDAYSCRNCLGDGGNGVFIFHPDGKMTLYWHLQ